MSKAEIRSPRDNSNNNLAMPTRIQDGGLLPGYDAVANVDPHQTDFSSAQTRQVDIGSLVHPFRYVYAAQFKGNADTATRLALNGSHVTAAVGATANSIVARNATGDLTANISMLQQQLPGLRIWQKI